MSDCTAQPDAAPPPTAQMYASRALMAVVACRTERDLFFVSFLRASSVSTHPLLLSLVTLIAGDPRRAPEKLSKGGAH